MISVYTARYALQKGENKYKKEHLTGIWLLRHALEKSEHISLELEEIETLYTAGAHGKPYLKGYEDLHFNISHCDGWAACAVADAPIGIDAEKIGAASAEGGSLPVRMIQKILTEREQKYLSQYQSRPMEYAQLFYRFWTLKESYLKWCGKGFFFDPKEVEFFFEGEEAEKQIRCSDPAVICRQRKLAEDCIMAICCQEKGESIYYESYN